MNLKREINIFKIMNIFDAYKTTSSLLRVIGTPPRLKLMRAIGVEEVCVCHLETIFPQWRQAFISQHLMALRKANVLVARKKGRFAFYRLQDVEILELVDLAAKVAGVELDEIERVENCDCPGCQTITKSETQVLSSSI